MDFVCGDLALTESGPPQRTSPPAAPRRAHCLPPHDPPHPTRRRRRAAGLGHGRLGLFRRLRPVAAFVRRRRRVTRPRPLSPGRRKRAQPASARLVCPGGIDRAGVSLFRRDIECTAGPSRCILRSCVIAKEKLFYGPAGPAPAAASRPPLGGLAAAAFLHRWM